MFRVENYVLLYINEYVKSIFENLSITKKMNEEIKTEMRMNLMTEIGKTVDNFIKRFNSNINRKSVLKMKENDNSLNSNFLNNYHEIFLDNGKITVDANESILVLSFHINDIVVKEFYDLSNYEKNKTFNPELEAHTSNFDYNYIVLDDEKILVFNENTVSVMNLTKLTRKDINFYPNIYYAGNNKKGGFFDLLRQIYDLMNIQKSSIFKIK